LFESYFASELLCELKPYCERVNIASKILLLVDNAPGHPLRISHTDENINVMFLPPNTTSLIQPMDEGVIASFKGYYLQKTFIRQVTDTTKDKEKLFVKDFWRNFNIKKVIDSTGDAWAQVLQSCLNGVWINIWPDPVSHFFGFDPEDRQV
jgi:hypothetical protein